MKVTTTKPSYLVELTYEEAQIIHLIMGRVGGDPKGPRRLTDQLWSELPEKGEHLVVISGSVQINRRPEGS